MQRRTLLITDLGHQLLDAFFFGDVAVGFSDLKMCVQVQSLWRGKSRRFRVSIEDHSAHERVLIDAVFQHWEEWVCAMFETQCLVVGLRGINGSDDNPPLMPDILSRDTSTLVGASTVSEVYINSTERVCLTC